MKNQYMERCVVLLSDESDRLKAFNTNKHLFMIHMLIAVFIAIIFIYIVTKDPDYIEAYGTSKLTFIIGMGVWFSCALFISSMMMWIPAALFAQTIKPEIFLCDNWMIYMSCSKSLNYSGISGFYPFFKYLLGYDSSQRIRNDEIVSVNIESANLLSPGLTSDTQLIIKHKHGKITLGRWLDLNEKKRIMDCLEKWRQLKSCQEG